MFLLRGYQESFIVDQGIAELKGRMDKKEKKLFVKWVTDTKFKMSLKFSIGTNYLFDINDESKSAINANGTLIELSENRTQIDIRTKFKYGLILILVLPIVMLILELILDLGIPVSFYLVFPLFFGVILALFKNEERKLIEHFKNQIGI